MAEELNQLLVAEDFDDEDTLEVTVGESTAYLGRENCRQLINHLEWLLSKDDKVYH